MVSIRGALHFLGVKLVKQANEKHETQLLENREIIYTNKVKLNSLCRNCIRELDGNGEIN